MPDTPKLSVEIPDEPPAQEKGSGPVCKFIYRHFRHFNAAVVCEAAEAYKDLLKRGGKMFVSIAGAMSTAELGISLAEMIREDKIHGICCTGANLEEDIFNLVAHEHYVRIPEYRDLTPKDEERLLDAELSRVTDTCIPEREAMNVIGELVADRWKECDQKGDRAFPHEFLYELLNSGDLEGKYQIDPKDSWMIAAAKKNLPLFVPGWEDSTLGNMYAAELYKGHIVNAATVMSGVEYMLELCNWYEKVTKGKDNPGMGYYQLGGGIAGDFAICVVPLLRADLKKKGIKSWSYFVQVSDSTTSYGSYSGAVPNEKVTWWKLDVDTPRFVIESDASIVAPLLHACVLGW